MFVINQAPGNTRGWKVAAPVVLALCGVLLVTSAKASGGDDLRGSDILEFSDLVRAEEQRVQGLEAQIADLSAEIEEIAADSGDDQTVEVDREAEKVMPAAGLTPVQGPALTVELDDAPLPSIADQASGELNIEDFIVHQQDLEGVINALWAGGAEAMTVMDQRMVSTSVIRCQGSILLLHGRTYDPPYTITAIGDVDTLRDALDASPEVADYRSWADRVGLGYKITDEGAEAMPAYSGSITGGLTS